jgi:hypothetical protein
MVEGDTIDVVLLVQIGIMGVVAVVLVGCVVVVLVVLQRGRRMSRAQGVLQVCRGRSGASARVTWRSARAISSCRDEASAEWEWWWQQAIQSRRL